MTSGLHAGTTPARHGRGDTLALSAAGVVVALVGLVWAGAAAARGAAHRAPPSVSSTAAALAHLPAHLTDPDEAWQPAAHFNTELFWATVLLLAVAIAAAARVMWCHRGTARRGDPSIAARAPGLARRIPALTVPQPQPGRLTLGRTGRQLVAAEAGASLAVIGPTGCGKTAGLVIPALLEWDGPVLAASVKTDLLDVTRTYRSSRGQVAVYDPTGMTSAASAGWDPVTHAETWLGAQRMAGWLCAAARPASRTLGDADYWITQAGKALAPHLYCAANAGETIAKVVEWVDQQQRSELFTLLDGDVRADSVAALRTLQSLWTKEDRLRSSIYATIETVLLGYADPGVQAAAAHGGLDFDAWLSGSNTIYLVAPAHEQDRLRPIFTVAAQAALRAAYTRADRDGGRLSRPCLVLLDEAGNTAPLPDLAAYATTARSHNITLVTVWHDLAQLASRYGKAAQTVLNNHRARVFGGGIADADTLRYLSTLIGDTTDRQPYRSTMVSTGDRLVGEHVSWRPAAPPDALRRLAADTAMLVYGAAPAARLQLRPWYRDPELDARASR